MEQYNLQEQSKEQERHEKAGDQVQLQEQWHSLRRLVQLEEAQYLQEWLVDQYNLQEQPKEARCCRARRRDAQGLHEGLWG